MSYQRGQPEDERMHAQFHKESSKGITYSGLRNEKVVANFEGDRIIIARDEGAAADSKKIKEIVAVVNDELGAVAQDSAALNKYKIYLYVAGKEVVGCLIAERISHAYRLLPEESPEGLIPFICSRFTFR